MKISIKLSEMKISKKGEDTLIAHDLGSGLGIGAYDPLNHVGGVFHFMLPSSTVYPELARKSPLMFADTGIPLFLDEIYKNGADKQRLEINLAGGACFVGNGEGVFAVGKENFWKTMELMANFHITVRRKEVGGRRTRSFYLNVGTGQAWIENGEEKIDL
jgi:chemotaxis protein CheD